MKNLLVIVLTVALLGFALVEAKDECEELKEQELQMKCDFTDFEDYRKCVQERKEIRRKRATICPITGKVIDIDRLSGFDSSAAAPQNNVNSFVHPAVALPPAVAADQPLHPHPAPLVTFDSRPPEVNHNWIVQGEDTNFVHNQRYHPARNVTTVIKLTNHINNTNVIHMPTHINATNINNITIFTNSSENNHDFGFGATKDGPCCMVVKPKTCHTGPMGPRCHHRRHKMCGNQCTSRIMHARSSRSHGVGYIPQPSPSCVYTEQWPFVNCGNRRRDPCDGCYDHYGSSNYGYYAPPSSCHGCYDEGFEYGQMYRRGPVLRPHYYHAPPPYYQTGYQGGYPGMYPDYPNYYEDDYYGPPGFMPEMHPPNYPFGMESPIIDDDFSRENSTEKKNGTSLEEDEWGITMQKCKVISGDGSITIANCTVDNVHPYAAAPSDFNYPGYNNYYPPARPYPGMYYPQPRFPFHRRPASNHKIAPLTSKKSSSEVVPRPIETEDHNTEIVEDDKPEDYDYDK